MRKRILATLLVTILLLPGCKQSAKRQNSSGEFQMGFGRAQLTIPKDSDQPLYIAGYHNGREILGVLDEQEARAVWIDDGSVTILLIAVDCIGLGSGTVQEIRARLASFCRETGCDSVNVISTHTHAGVDTLGLWGPVGIDGKNPDFMENVIQGAVSAAKEAYEDRSAGTLQYSATPTEGLQADSREPQVYDDHLYQIRFQPEDSQQNGIRIISFAAHAEALRGENRLVSRDYPGVLCDAILEKTGDDALYLPGAIGGLIMTPKLTEEPFNAFENLRLTGEKLTQYALAQTESLPLAPNIRISRVKFEIPLENTLFLYYKFLGVVQNDARQRLDGTYLLSTELTVLQLGDLTLVLLPGEICPELVSGTANTTDPAALQTIAAQYGVEKMMVVGLANDEIGYILPPSNFVVDDELPYLQEAEGDHYEETNSVGKACAEKVAEAFVRALKQLK